MNWKVEQGDSIEAARSLGKFDAIVTDPPYELGFMGRGWDSSGVAFKPETWRAFLDAAKPGAHLVAFGGSRTYHRIACAIEDSGWVIRDCLMWIYGSGFPKNLDVSKAIDREAGVEREVIGVKGVGNGNTRGAGFNHEGGTGGVLETAPATEAAKQWDGWGTALKPAFEPIILARKPLQGTVAANVQRHGTGAINVDGCRVGSEQRHNLPAANRGDEPASFAPVNVTGYQGKDTLGRWPANVILDEEAGAMLDAQSGMLQSGEWKGQLAGATGPAHGTTHGNREPIPLTKPGDSGGASRFFYTAKASRSEREQGLEHRHRRNVNDGRDTSIDNPYQRGDTERANIHPTVKPVDLMRWLVRLVAPPGGVVFDPFAGSGTTGMACAFEDRDFHGIDLEAEHVELARERICAALEEAGKATIDDIPDTKTGRVQMGLFGKVTT